MAPVVFSAAARAELIEARDWYSVRGAELAARFTAEIETVVEELAAAPYQFPVVYIDVRRAAAVFSVCIVLSDRGRDCACYRLLSQQPQPAPVAERR